MARASIDILGDSASALTALDRVDASVSGLVATLDKAAASTESSSSAITGALGEEAAGYEGLAAKVETTTAAMVAASTRRIETMRAEASAAKDLAASYAAGSTEQQAALALSARKTASANRLAGVEAAAARPSITQTAGTIGRGLTTYATIPAAAIGYEAVKQAVSFNQQMLLLKTQAGDATDSINRLSSAVLEMAKTSPQGPVELAQGLFHLVSLGLRGSQALGTLKEASMAAGMGIANLEDTTTALGSAVVAGVKGAQNYSQAMGTLVATAGSGNMRMEDLASSLGSVIPSAAASGVSLKEMGAAMAVLTDRGMSADTAATRLRMTFGQIQAPSAAALKAFQDLGVNGSSLAGMLRQPDGLLKVLDLLHTRIHAVGQDRGYADLLNAFGRSRGGLGIEALVKSLDQPLSSYSQKLQLIDQQQQQFAANQQAYMESPSYKLHAALSSVEADLVKLGQSLTPAVTGLADTISGIANAFTALPASVKETAGVIVAILAVGGPVGLAIKGLGTLLGGLRSAFLLLGPSAATGGAEADASLAGVGSAATAAEGEVAGLRAGLLSLGGPQVVAAIAVGVASLEAYDKIKALHMHGLFPSGNPGGKGGAFTNAHKLPGGDEVYQSYGRWYTARYNQVQGTPISAAEARRLMSGDADRAARVQQAEDRAGHPRTTHPNVTHHGGGPISSFQLPQQIQIELAKAQAGQGNLGKAEADARAYTQRMIRSGRLTGPALVQAYDELASLQTKATSAANKAKTAFDKTVTNDQLLSQARLDLANGELGAERALLDKDRLRLQALLQEASTSAERNEVLKQLATVTKMLHTKSDQFALSPKLQEEMARADALAALQPDLQGPTSLQIRLAEQAKAAAMKAINSHTLTLQGLTAAWQIVQQENSVLAQTKAAIDTYHAVSSAAIVGSVKGLTHLQQLQLRERIAQAEAHRGYAPNQPGSHHSHHKVDVDVHVKSNDSHIVKVVDKHNRQNNKRAGSRR